MSFHHHDQSHSNQPIPSLQRKTLASVVSFLVSVILLAMKYSAYKMTGSVAVLSDALESIVNVVAALLVLIVIRIASQPPDTNHPYGHGKFELFSAAFEGGLIFFASGLIGMEAVKSLVFGHELRDLNLGLLVVGLAGVINFVLGWFLVRVGKKSHSSALIASGRHVLSDFWTSLGVVLGVALVAVTGWGWLDPLVAIVVASFLCWTALKILRSSFAGLTDEEDLDLLKRIQTSIQRCLRPGVIQVHHVRTIRAGDFVHMDAHIVVPEFWSVSEGHENTNRFAMDLEGDLGRNFEVAFHVDPCRRAYCQVCDLPSCPVRVTSFEAPNDVNLRDLRSPFEPEEFQGKRQGKEKN